MNKLLPVQLNSEIGRLRAVLMHRPGLEIEAMTPANAHTALYSDILNLTITRREYARFAGALEKCTQVYYVEDLLTDLVKHDDIMEVLIKSNCSADGAEQVYDELAALSPEQLSKALIEGYVQGGKNITPNEVRLNANYALKPLYNLFFTRDASSCVYSRALINSMSFDVRARESLLYSAIFSESFRAGTFCAMDADPKARTEGGDVQVVRDDLLCVGCGIRTNKRGINYLLHHANPEKERFSIVVQELPHKPDSFIHLDMVFTFLGPHACMVYEPMLSKTGLFSNMDTYVLTREGDRVTTTSYPDILTALAAQGVNLQPVLCGNAVARVADREQWHSGANFFAFGEDHVIGYSRNEGTISALNHAGYEVLDAEAVALGKLDPWQYEKAVVTFDASELPRAGGGARCMTCPINREETSWD
ncbi:MAG: arginine deiminase [Bacteroidales bacterium]|nr:arginine deiminase [Bacteroidales bacterium]